MRAVIVREKDNSTRKFDVHVWPNKKIILNDPSAISSELAGPFIVPQDGSFDFYGIFIDLRLWQDEWQVIQKDLRMAWNPIFLQNWGSLPIPQTEMEKLQRRKEIEPIFKQFLVSDPSHSTERFLRLFNWFAGQYSLTIVCDVYGDKKGGSRTWKFILVLRPESFSFAGDGDDGRRSSWPSPA